MIADETHTVAAHYYLAKFLGIRADDSALHDWMWEAVYENGVDESKEDDAYDSISESLRSLYQHEPERCLERLGRTVGRRKQEAAESVQRFIRRVAG